MGDEFSFEDVQIILRRRLPAFLIPMATIALLGLLTVLLLPARYTATGTILVVGAEIPPDLVRSTISDFAQQRIEAIRARVMTRARVLEIADKYTLYPRKRGFSDTERVARIRKDVGVSLIRAEGAQISNNRDSTIAFNVSVTNRSADKAYLVANEIMSLFLSEDVRTRTAGAENTTDFFKDQAGKLAAQVSAMETSIAKFKTDNADALPETLDSRKLALDRAQQEMSNLEATVGATEEELRFIETQLATAGATSTTGPGAELAAKRAELASLRAIYTDSHPNVVALQREIAQLAGASGGVKNREVSSLQQALVTASDELRALEKTTPATDPAVVAKRDEISSLQNRMSQAISRANTGGDALAQQMQGRHAIATSRLGLLNSRRDELRKRMDEMEAAIARTPEVDRALAALSRDYDTVRAEYKDIVAKQQAAQLSQNLEQNQKGEKFTILDPAVKPDQPSSPDRAKLAVFVLFLAIAAGAGAAALMELAFGSVRGANHLTRIVDQHPIAVIPYIYSDAEPRRMRMPMPKPPTRKKAAKAAAAATMAAFAGVALAQPPAAAPDAGDLPQA